MRRAEARLSFDEAENRLHAAENRSCAGAWGKMTDRRPIVVAGAGGDGLLVGGMLAAHGHDVTLAGSARLWPSDQKRMAASGRTSTGWMEPCAGVKADPCSQDPACSGGGGIVLVTVPRGMPIRGHKARLSLSTHPCAVPPC